MTLYMGFMGFTQDKNIFLFHDALGLASSTTLCCCSLTASVPRTGWEDLPALVSLLPLWTSRDRGQTYCDFKDLLIISVQDGLEQSHKWASKASFQT